MHPANHQSVTVVCDAHVHVYDCFDLDLFLDSAWNNLSSIAASRGCSDNFAAVLMLTEAKSDHWFSDFCEHKHTATEWQPKATDEAESVYAVNNEGHTILIINGRQIVTSENLEVLALATDKVLPDGQPIDEVVHWAQQNNALAVIPWGFGKWWGQRGKILSSLLDRVDPEAVHLGDNSGRPWFLGKPAHFNRAELENRRILPGSDPLPFATEAWRPGSVGFTFSASLNPDKPATGIKDSLCTSDTAIEPFMKCESLVPFLKNQIGMQLKKRI